MYRPAVRFFGRLSGEKDNGYGETSSAGFLLKLSIAVGNERRPVYLVVPHVYKKTVEQKTDGYEAVDNGSPFDDFGFPMGKGPSCTLSGTSTGERRHNMSFSRLAITW